MRSVREALFRAELDWREASLLRAMALETVRYLERSGTPFEVPEALRDVGRGDGSEIKDQRSEVRGEGADRGPPTSNH